MGRSGSGSVGKGGREANYAPPVDQYRKRIARQDSRKEKSHLKEVKHAQETKDVAPKAVKQIVSYLFNSNGCSNLSIPYTRILVLICFIHFR